MRKLVSVLFVCLLLSAKPFAQEINFVLNNPTMVPNPGTFPGGTETIEFDFFLQSVVGAYNLSSNDLSNNYGFITFSFTKLDPTGILPTGTGAALFNWTLTNNGLAGTSRVYTWTGTTKTIAMQPSPPAAKYKIRFENVPITFPATKAETDIRVAGQWTDPGSVSLPPNTTIFVDNFAAIATYTCTPVNAGGDGSTTVCDNSTAVINLFDLITDEEPGGTWARTGGTGGTFNAAAGTYTPEPGATTSTFTYTIAGVDQCPGDQSVATVNIVPQLAVSIAPAGPYVVCTGAGITLTATPTGGAGTCTVQWQSSPNGTTGWENIGSATGNSFVVPTGTAGNFFYRAMYSCTPMVCAAANSNVVNVTVSQDPSISISPSASTVCVGGSVQLSAQVSGGTGTCSIQWQSSTTGTGGWSNVGTGSTYNPSTTTVGTLYYRALYNCTGEGCNEATSGNAVVTVVADPSISIAPSSSSVCVGGSVVLTASPSGGTGTCTIQWQSSPNGTTGWTNITSANGTTYTVPTGTPGTTYYQATYTCTGGGCDAATSNTATVEVTPGPSISITPAGTTTVCVGGSVTLNATPANGTGDCTIQWQRSNSLGGPWDNIGGATNATYNVPTGTPGTVYYRATYTCTGTSCAPAASNVVTVVVNADPSVSISPANSTVCVGGSVTLTATPSGGAGTCTVQWQSSTSADGPFNDINGATGNTYNAPTGNAGVMYYQARYTCTGGGCDAATSNTATVTVVNDPSIGISPTSSTVCVGGSVILTATPADGTGTCTIQWQSSPNGNTNWANINGANGTTYNVSTNAPGTTYYRATYSCTGNGCGSATSNTSSVTVVSDPSISITPSGSTVCVGGSVTLTANAGGGTGDCAIVWQSSTTGNAPWTNVGAGNTYNPNTTIVGVMYYRALYNCTGDGCNEAISGNATVTVVADPSIRISANNSNVCVGGSVILTATPGGGAGTCTVQWQSSPNGTDNWTNIIGATGNTYTAPTGIAGTFYYRATYTCTGSGCDAASSNTVTVTVNPGPTINITPVGTTTVCVGGSVLLTANTADGTGQCTIFWQKSNSPTGPWDDIDGGEGPTYNVPTGITGTTYYRALYSCTGSSCAAAASNVVTVVVNADPSISISPSNNTVCVGGSVTLTASPLGGAGTCTIQWQSSATGEGGWTSVGTGTTYNVPTNATGIMYYRTTYTCTGGGCDAATSNTAVVTVVADPSISISPGSATVCVGGNVTLTANASGGAGNCTIQWQSSPNGNTNWANINGANGITYNVSTNAPGTTYYRASYTCTGGGCDAANSDNAMVTVVADPSISIAPSSSTVCVGGSVMLTANASGGTGTCTIQWQSSPTGTGNWTNIDGATGTTFSAPTNTIGTFYYRATYTCTGGGCDAATSANATVTVVADPSIRISPENSTVCVGGTVLLTASTGGGAGTCTIQWQSSTTGTGGWTNINGANNATFLAPTQIAGTMYYRATYSCTGGGCDAAASNTASVVVTPGPGINITPSTSTVCVGGPVVLTATTSDGTGTCTIQWQSSTTGTGGWTNMEGANGITYMVPTGSVGTLYYRATYTCSGSSCDPAASNVATVVVNADPFISISPTNSSSCIGASVVLTASTSGGAGTCSVQWQSSTTGTGGWTDISGATGTTYSVPTSNAGTMYYSATYNCTGGGCDAATSAVATVTVTRLEAPTVSVIQPTCTVPSGTITVTSPTGQGVEYSINGTAWQSSNVFNNVMQGTYQVTVRTTAGCVSAPAPVTINPPPGTPPVATFTVIPPSCTVPTATITITSPIGPGFQYSLDGVNYQSSPTFTNVVPGTYAIRVRNSDGCISTTSQFVVNGQPPTPSAPAVSVTQPICPTTTGTIVVTSPTGAGLEYSLNGTTWQTSVTFSNVPAGTYNVRVRNSFGCVSNTTVAVINNVEPCGSADLRITKAVDNTTPLVGTQVTFSIVVTNGGPDPATGVVVNDALPSGYTYVSHTTSTGTYTSGTGVWNIGNLAVNASATMTITATVRGTGNYTNTATVRGNEFDPNLNNNTATAATNPIPIADLRVVKTVNNATPQIGSNVTFTILVTNLGPSPATGVTVTDLLPSGYTYISHTSTTGTFNPATGVWTIGNLAVGGAATLTITATVNATGEYANTATVRGNETDPNLPNNTSTVTVNPRQPDPSDLIITKSGSGEAAPGGQMMYTITVRNQGAGPATNVVITDQIPAFLNNPEYSLNGTTDWLPWPGTYTVGSLQPGQTFTLYIRATIDPTACDEITNTASVATSSVDNNPNNNSSTVKTKMAVGDDTFKLIANWSFKNNQGSYPVVADNLIPGITSVITSSEPYNYTASGVATGQLAFEYSGNSGAIYMQPSTGDNERYWQLEISGPNLYIFNQFSWYFQAERLPKAATRINYAYSKDGVNFIFNGGVDLVQQNKWEEVRTDWSALGDLNGQDLDKLYIRLYATGSDSRLVSDATRLELSNFQLRAFAQRRDIVCEGDPDLTITKSAGSEASPGSEITYRITARNQGDGRAENVVLTDELPQFLNNPEYSLNGTTGWQPWTGSYSVGTLQPNQTITLFIRATIDALACGEIINTASVSTTSNDVNPDNNSIWVKTKMAVGNNGTQVLANFKFLNSPTGYPIVADNMIPGITAIITSSEAFNYTASGVASGQLAFEYSGNSGAIYMQPSSGENTRYWQLELSGPNLYIFNQFSMYLQSERLPQGAKRINFAYSTDGINFTFNGGMDLPQQNQWYEVVTDWSGIPELNGQNLDKLYVRLYAAGSDARGISDATRLEISNFQIRGFAERREINCVRDITGTVYNDGNCQTDNIVNGKPTNAEGLLWVNLLDQPDKVVATSKVAENGTYSFLKVGEQGYKLQLSTTAGVAGQAAPATLLPVNYVHTGEHVGAGAGSDGTADGMLAIAASKANVGQANFGIQQLPTTNNVTVDIMDPLMSGQSLVLDKEPNILNGQDAEDSPVMGSMHKGSTFKITTLPVATDGILSYNGQPVVAGQVLTSFNPALLVFVAARNFDYGEKVCFSYTIADACGLFDPTPASYCIQSAVVVPVTGLVLTAQRIPNSRDVDLGWKTRSENNASHYIMERSANGTNFAPVSGNMPSLGNSQSERSYNMVDRNVPSQLAYYRVRSIDRDGRSRLSNTVTVRFNEDGRIKGIRVFPNPVISFVTIEFGENGNYRVDAIEMSGKMIPLAQEVRITNSLRSITIQKGFLPAGTYILRITNLENGMIENVKVVTQDR